MSYYSSEADLRELLKRPTEQQVSTALLNICQRKADSFINSALSALYTIPIATSTGAVPDEIRTIAEELTLWFLCGTTPLGGAAATVYQPKDLEKRKEEVKEWLKRLAEGKASISGVDRSKTSVMSSTSTYSTVFNLDDELNWTPDADMLSDIADDRS